MQTFAIMALDKPGHLELRLATRPTHLDYWQDNGAPLVFGGPFLDDKGRPCGTLVVVKADDAAAARSLIDNDPYALVGLFAEVTVRPWNWVLKRPEEV